MSVSFYDDLNASFDYAWQQLQQAVTDRTHGFRIIQIATLTADDRPSIRSVVLRDVDHIEHIFRFHTDRCSHKAEELRRREIVAAHVYDPSLKLQLRLWGHARLHEDDAVAEQAWQEAAEMSRICYRIQPASGSPLPDPWSTLHAVPDQAHDDPGRDRFMVVTVAVDCLEWLYLAHTGHRRARWQNMAEGWQGEWLVP